MINSPTVYCFQKHKSFDYRYEHLQIHFQRNRLPDYFDGCVQKNPLDKMNQLSNKDSLLYLYEHLEHAKAQTTSFFEWLVIDVQLLSNNFAKLMKKTKTKKYNNNNNNN